MTVFSHRETCHSLGTDRELSHNQRSDYYLGTESQVNRTIYQVCTRNAPYSIDLVLFTRHLAKQERGLCILLR